MVAPGARTEVVHYLLLRQDDVTVVGLLLPRRLDLLGRADLQVRVLHGLG